MSIHDTERDDVLCTIRQIFGDGVAREREDALRELARSLGYHRISYQIRDILGSDLLTAVRRGILRSESGVLSLVTGDIHTYTRDSLKADFLTAIGRGWIDRQKAVRKFARHLGYRRTGSKIEDTGRSLINGLLRDGRLESQGQTIRRLRI